MNMMNMNMYTGMNTGMYNYQPVFKQYAIGSGIDMNEFNTITQSASKAMLSRMNPLSTSIATLIKQTIGGEWFVFVSPVNNNNYDFCLSTVSGSDFLSFSLDNTMFQVCRLR
jgi:hypothetical protein